MIQQKPVANVYGIRNIPGIVLRAMKRRVGAIVAGQIREVSRYVPILGTAKQAEMTARYHDLVEFLGEPTESPGRTGETCIQWRVIFRDGTVVTVYDGRNAPLVAMSLPEYRWSIGGHTQAAATLMQAAWELWQLAR